MLTLLLMLLLEPVVASTPQEMLDRYFKRLQSSLEELDDASLSRSERVKLRGALLNGHGYWIMKHGGPGRAANLVGLVYRKKPTAWHITPRISHEKFAILYVDFNMPEFPGHPWRTELDLVRILGKWQIRSFTDITRRPLPAGSNINTVLNGYFMAAVEAVESLASDELSRNEKQAVQMMYGLGAGYWIARNSGDVFPPRKLFTSLISMHPVSWKIEPAKVAGRGAETIVHLASGANPDKEVFDSYVFRLKQDRGEWFIVEFEKK